MKTILFMIWTELSNMTGSMKQFGDSHIAIWLIVFVILLTTDVYGWFKKESE